jgi:hypothetical protein
MELEKELDHIITRLFARIKKASFKTLKNNSWKHKFKFFM